MCNKIYIIRGYTYVSYNPLSLWFDIIEFIVCYILFIKIIDATTVIYYHITVIIF